MLFFFLFSFRSSIWRDQTSKISNFRSSRQSFFPFTITFKISIISFVHHKITFILSVLISNLYFHLLRRSVPVWCIAISMLSIICSLYKTDHICLTLCGGQQPFSLLPWTFGCINSVNNFRSLRKHCQNISLREQQPYQLTVAWDSVHSLLLNLLFFFSTVYRGIRSSLLRHHISKLLTPTMFKMYDSSLCNIIIENTSVFTSFNISIHGFVLPYLRNFILE